MTLFSWIVFILVGFLSFLPLTRLSAFKVNRRLINFRYTSFVLFLWSVVLLLRFVVTSPYVIYYLFLSVYPLVFASIALLFLALNRYVGNKRRPLLEIILAIIFLLISVASFTNSLHMEMLKIAPSQSITIDAMRFSNFGWMFIVLLILDYLGILAIVVLVVTKLYDDLKKDNDYFPFIIAMVGIVVTVTLNIINIFYRPFVLDPTYLSYVLFLSLLYFLIAIRDMKIITYFDNNNLIIDNLREMYVIVNQRNIVIDASKDLIRTFDVDMKNEELYFDELMKKMSDRSIIYRDSKDLGNYFIKDKLYLHMKQKEIKMPMFKYSGILYMFYDETESQKYITELDYVLSHDLMTNIYNRNYYEEIKKNIESDSRNYCIIVFDLDGLKLRNDFFGHEAGDDYLFRFARILVQLSEDKEGRIPIRMGGDEFVLILQDVNEVEVETVIEKIHLMAQDSDPFQNIMFSFGHFLNESKNIPIDKSLAKADELMYEVKKGNRLKKQEFEEYLKSISKEK